MLGNLNEAQARIKTLQPNTIHIHHSSTLRITRFSKKIPLNKYCLQLSP